jgi:salicylate biosynthesis isochorismate synthase
VASAGIESNMSQNLETRIAHATRAKTRAMLRIDMEIPAWDPWRFLERARDESRPWFAWSSRDNRETFIALGAVSHHASPGEAGWAASGAFCLSMTEQAIRIPFEEGHPIAPDVPLLVGGLSFTTSVTELTDSPWTGWSNGALWVPELVLMERGGEGVACLTYAWAQGDDPRRVAAWARERARDLANPPTSPLLRQASRAPRRPSSAHEERIWADRVESALEAIEDEAMDKVVLARSARFWAGAGEIFDVTNTLRALKRDQPDCDVFAVGHPNGSVFLGASPEPLLETQGRQASTVALAGTVGRGAGPEEDQRRSGALLKSEKNAREHQLVVEAIVEALEPLSERMETRDVARIRTLTQVHHLETPIAARLDADVDTFEVLASLHPTPATCGWPRSAASDWIRDHEGLDRGWYAGPVGWLNGRGDSRFSVALRSALIRGDEAHAFSGAGLVKGSTADGEWHETEMKLQAISQSLMTRPWATQGEAP